MTDPKRDGRSVDEMASQNSTELLGRDAKTEEMFLARHSFKSGYLAASKEKDAENVAEIERRLRLEVEQVKAKVWLDSSFQTIEKLQSLLTQSLDREKVLLDALKSASSILDAIKYDLYASVYTLSDDEFGMVFTVRDLADMALAKHREMKGEKE